jgi:hypothetical protein
MESTLLAPILNREKAKCLDKMSEMSWKYEQKNWHYTDNHWFARVQLDEEEKEAYFKATC